MRGGHQAATCAPGGAEHVSVLLHPVSDEDTEKEADGDERGV